MKCTRCGRENEADTRFCARCGIELATLVKRPVEVEDDSVPCSRHPRRTTRIRCGKCDRPFCDRCLVHTPAGQRCRECLPKDVGFRPGAIGLGIRRTFRELFANPSRIWLLIIIFSMGAAVMRGCNSMRRSQEPVRQEQVMDRE